MEKLRQLTARHGSGRQLVVSVPFDNKWPQSFEQVDTNNHSQAVRPLLRKRIIRLVPGRLKRILSYAWVLEISSIGIAILTLAAMYITLAMHRDRPLPHWPGLISINSLIAIFTVILKVTLMMPVAEGVGQLKWHWFQESRSLIDLDQFDAASRGPWGSILLIFSTYKHPLAVSGAFIMLLALAIEPFSQQVTQYYQCLQPIPNVIASIPRTNNYTAPDYYLTNDDALLDSTMVAALYTGLLLPPRNATSSIPFQCFTGNCTFPEDHGSTHSSLAICSSCSDISRTVIRPNNSDTYSLPSGPTIGTFGPLTPVSNHFRPDLRWMSSSASMNVGFNDTDYIFGFDALMCRVPPSCKDSDTYDCGYEPFAVNCIIYACMKTYRASITNFVLEEELVNTTRLPMIYYQNREFLKLNSSRIAGPSKLYSGIPNIIPWQMGLFSNGTASLASANTYLEGLANAMTSVIRQRGDTPSTDFVHGTVYGLQTCIKVQWAWLALPSALIIFTIIFLLVTIITTRSWNMTWKSSTLALLFHGLDTISREQYGEMMDLSAMENAARQAQAKLVASDAGRQFVIK
ncbi:hypothetical protein MMC07_005316 [Pseudocyphellaria aurata]|nr:hypothetical protein [Pseudocyphellaria aurata]